MASPTDCVSQNGARGVRPQSHHMLPRVACGAWVRKIRLAADIPSTISVGLCEGFNLHAYRDNELSSSGNCTLASVGHGCGVLAGQNGAHRHALICCQNVCHGRFPLAGCVQLPFRERPAIVGGRSNALPLYYTKVAPMQERSRIGVALLQTGFLFYKIMTANTQMLA